MALLSRKHMCVWSACLAICAIAGLVWWTVSDSVPTHESALEVGGVQTMPEEKRQSEVKDGVQTGETVAISGESPKASSSATPVSRSTIARFQRPATGVVSSPFGKRWGRMHEGVDIADEAGTPILAALSGQVRSAGWISGYGYTVILAHREGYTTLYGHMQQVLVAEGDVVERGQRIGLMGSTGNSTGPHVHFEVRRDEKLVDPSAIL